MPNLVATPTIKNPWLDRHAQFCELAKSEPIDLLFLGDSITEGWATQGSLTWKKYYNGRKTANFGINGERIQNLLWRVTNGCLDGISPRLIVVLIGTNNAARNPLTDIIGGYEVLLREIQTRCPLSELLLLSIFPREADSSAPRRKLVEDINSALAALQLPPKVHLMNIGTEFLDPDGHLPARLFPDGLHPAAEAYAIWARAMEPFIKRHLDAPGSIQSPL